MPSHNVDTKKGDARKTQTYVIAWQNSNHNNKTQYSYNRDRDCHAHATWLSKQAKQQTNKNEHSVHT